MIGLSDKPGGEETRWSRRLLWFALIWLAGLAVIGTLAYAIRAVIL